MHCRNRSRKVLPEVFDIFQPDIQPHDSVAVIRAILVSVKIVRGREARYARRVASLVFLPVLKLWVPRPCDFCKGGHDAADGMRSSCPLAYIGLPFFDVPGAPDPSSPFSNKRQKYRFVVVGYVVMPEHIHLLITEPETQGPGTRSLVVRTGRSRL